MPSTFVGRVRGAHGFPVHSPLHLAARLWPRLVLPRAQRQSHGRLHARSRDPFSLWVLAPHPLHPSRDVRQPRASGIRRHQDLYGARVSIEASRPSIGDSIGCTDIPSCCSASALPTSSFSNTFSASNCGTKRPGPSSASTRCATARLLSSEEELLPHGSPPGHRREDRGLADKTAVGGGLIWNRRQSCMARGIITASTAAAITAAHRGQRG